MKLSAKMVALILAIVISLSAFTVYAIGEGIDLPVVPGVPGVGVQGDVNGDGEVNDADATYLLMNLYFGNEVYPIHQNQDCDFDGDDNLTEADAIALLSLN